MTNYYSLPPNAYNTVKSPTNCFSNVFNPMTNISTNGYDPKSMFNNNNFVNRGDILHNNLNNILLNEEIREYSV